MNKSFWKPKLLPLLEPNKEMNKMGEDLYCVKEKYKVAFWFEGGLKIAGTQATLSVNLKDPHLLVLSTLIRKTMRVYRIPYERLVCFELIRGSDVLGESDTSQFSKN